MKTPMQSLLEEFKNLTDKGIQINNKGAIMLIESALMSEQWFIEKLVEKSKEEKTKKS